MSKQSTHSFDVEDAKEYGVECAVLLFNIRYWLDKNKANEKHIHDGRVWTYNSTKAFAELFPYLSEKQIYRRLKKLEDAGILLTGNYNKNAYDQTKWYSVDEAEYCIPEDKEIQFPKSENGKSESGEPIPDINTNNKPDNTTRAGESFTERLDSANTKQELLDLWIEYRKSKNKHAGLQEQDIILNRDWKGKDVDEIRESIAYTVKNGWLTLQWPELEKQESLGDNSIYRS